MVRKLLLRVKAAFSMGKRTPKETPKEKTSEAPHHADSPRRQSSPVPHTPSHAAKPHPISHRHDDRPAQKQAPRPQHRPVQARPPRERVVMHAHDPNWTPSQFPVEPEPGKVRFHDLNLPDPIMHAVADLGFKFCTPIQALSLPHTLDGKDMMGKAQTGTGKTAAFLITALDRLYRKHLSGAAGTQPKGSPRVLILAPTRELVVQISRDAEGLGKYLPLRTLAVFGGTDFNKQKDELHNYVIDIVAATPGRLLDFHRTHDINLRNVEILVLDEADRMLDMGFIPDVRRIIRSIPEREHRQTLFFSATLNETVTRLASQWTRSPIQVDIEPENVAVDTVKQTTMFVRTQEKLTVLFNVLNQEKPTRTLVFCNRRDTAERISDRLKSHDIHCALLSGSVNQVARMRTLDDFRAGKIPVVVATDVAGRGIHVDGIDLVINFDIPNEPEAYVHRIGRTGRAGALGRSYMFACEEEAFSLPDIEKFIGRPLEYAHPSEQLLTPLPTPAHPMRERTRDSARPFRSGPPPRHGSGPRRGPPPRTSHRSSRPPR